MDKNQQMLIQAQITQAMEDALLNRKKTRWYELVLVAGAAGGLITVGIGIAQLFMR